MAKEMRFWYDEVMNWFSIMEKKEGKFSTHFRYYGREFSPLMEIIDNRTDRVIGYINEGSDLSEDYEDLKKLLEENPIKERFDVPELGLSGARMEEIVDVIYERHVLNKVVAK